jgi:hypothetical protein
VAYPGDLVGNLPSLVEQSAPGSGALVPPYPLAVLADHPNGPAAAHQQLATASADVRADARGGAATTTLTGTDTAGAVTIGAVTTSTQTGVEDGRLTARARVEVSSVGLLLGALELRDVVVDVVATTDGTTGATDGQVEVGAVAVGGTPLPLGSDGLVGGSVLDELLAAAGVHVSIGGLDEVVDGAAARVDAAGVTITVDADGREGPLAALLALVPTDQLPGTGIPGLPLNTSPQALVNLLKESHVVRVALAPVVARVAASPTPEQASTPAPGQGVAVPGSSTRPGVAPTASPFTTPLPDADQPTRPASATGGLVPGRAVEAVLVVLLVGSVPVWWRLSGRLMDACLGAGAPRCRGKEPA